MDLLYISKYHPYYNYPDNYYQSNSLPFLLQFKLIIIKIIFDIKKSCLEEKKRFTLHTFLITFYQKFKNISKKK
jgi:hypothetical protein